MRFEKKLREFGDSDSIGSGFLPSLDWKNVFWGENYVKLLKIKIKYDPDNVFTCYHCVGSDRTDMMDLNESSWAPKTAACHGLTNVVLFFASSIIFYI